MSTQTRVTDALGELAQLDSADAVAELLQRKGITGHRASADMCPIANYVREAASRGRATPVDVSVGTDDLAWWGMVTFNQHRHTLPKPARDFILAFDRGKYPNLQEIGSK